MGEIANRITNLKKEKRDLTVEQIEAFVSDYINTKMSTEEISTKHGVVHSGIYYWLSRLGIPRREGDKQRRYRELKEKFAAHVNNPIGDDFDEILRSEGTLEKTEKAVEFKAAAERIEDTRYHHVYQRLESFEKKLNALEKELHSVKTIISGAVKKDVSSASAEDKKRGVFW